MKEILGKAKTIRELLGGAKYSIDYYQREYRWQTKQITGQNLLARSLHSTCYQNNPGFLRFIETTGLPFKPLASFNSAEMEECCTLYLKLAEHIWDPNRVMEAATA